jgi:hypothetical protein
VSTYFITKTHFQSEELLAHHPTPNLEDHPLSGVQDYLFNIFTVTLHIGGHSSIHNLKTRHNVTGTHSSHGRVCTLTLTIQHEDHMCPVTLSPVTCLPLPIFPHYLINGTILGRTVIEHKMCDIIFSTSFV